MRTLTVALFTALTALMLVSSASAQDANQSKFRKAYQRVQRREAREAARQSGQHWAQRGQQGKTASAQGWQNGRRGQAVAGQRRADPQGRAWAGQRGNGRKVAAGQNGQRPGMNKGNKQRQGPDARRPMNGKQRVAAGKGRQGGKKPKVAAAKTRRGAGQAPKGAPGRRPAKWQRDGQRPAGAEGPVDGVDDQDGMLHDGEQVEGEEQVEDGNLRTAMAKPAPDGALKARWAKKQSKGDRRPSKVDIKKAPAKKSAASMLRSKDG